MSKISALDVRDFFKTADLELAELVLGLGQDVVKLRVDGRVKQAAGMAKARAARKPKAGTGTPAPAHTAGATSIESDEVVAAAS